VPSLDDVASQHTTLAPDEIDRLRRIVLHWHLLADLSFADLVLWVLDADGLGYWAAAQIRPTTGTTAFADDLVGTFVRKGRRPLIDEAFRTGRITREGDPEWRDDVPVRVETVPVVGADRVLAVIARTTTMRSIRTPSQLEVTYLLLAADLARMISTGRFPTRDSDEALGRSPRVGDGLAHLDAEGEVEYVSPNGLSAFRRLGLTGDLAGLRLGAVAAALVPPDRHPVVEGLEQLLSGRSERCLDLDNDRATLTIRVVPLGPAGRHSGALALMRDITDLRQRERELLSREATIREIHHRVKNNLQTVAALLRMQSRRTTDQSARSALEEATRRVGSVALVHDLLSQTLTERVDFDAVLDSLIQMVGDVSSAGVAVRIERTGTVGQVDAGTATTLAVALTELLANALEHGARGRPDCTIQVTAGRCAEQMRLEVDDDGPGLPEGFDVETTQSLGLRIVRTLAESELGGQLTIGPRPGGAGGTRAKLVWPRAGASTGSTR
jgi:two-component sensor histidine kinase